MMKGAASPEHERLVRALADYFRSQTWAKNIRTPADKVRDMQPDVQCTFESNFVYGEAKLCEDFPAQDTQDQLAKYIRELCPEYNLYLAVPRECQLSIHQTLGTWGLRQRIELEAL